MEGTDQQGGSTESSQPAAVLEPSDQNPSEPDTEGRSTQHDMLTISSRRDGDVEVVEAVGELDLATVEPLRAEIKRVLAGDADRVLLDLSRLEFIDSTGIRLLLEVHREASQRGDRLRMRRGSLAVQRVIELSGLDTHLPFSD